MFVDTMRVHFRWLYRSAARRIIRLSLMQGAQNGTCDIIRRANYKR